MKRWIRRILFSLSIALMVAAVGLTIRGMYAADFFAAESILLMNDMRGCGARINWGYPYQVMFNEEGHFHSFTPENKTWEFDLPSIELKPRIGVWLPHWVSFVVGAAYPAFVWLRHWRRKKDVGFPVEVKDEGGRMKDEG